MSLYNTNEPDNWDKYHWWIVAGYLLIAAASWILVEIYI